jgi:peptidoglycan/LPS O-acetylase OafA/YrhL
MAVAWLLRSRSIPFPAGLAAAGACLFAGAVTWAGAARSLTISMHFIAGAGAALLMLGMVRLEDQAAFTVPAPLRFLGDASYSIYLIHYPVFLLCAPLLYRLFHRYPGPIFIPFALLMAIGVAAGCLMHIAVELPLLRRLPR